MEHHTRDYRERETKIEARDGHHETAFYSRVCKEDNTNTLDTCR